jgi:hypothetical protein
LFEISTTGKPTTETNDLIDEAIAALTLDWSQSERRR